MAERRRGQAGVESSAAAVSPAEASAPAEASVPEALVPVAAPASAGPAGGASVAAWRPTDAARASDPTAEARAGDLTAEARAGDPTAEALAPLRDRIDAIDQEIVALLNERAQIARRIGRVKQVTGRRTVRDAAREAQVLEHVTSASAGLFPEPELVALYRKLIAATRRVQHAQKRESRRQESGESSAD
jgi:chorismate mutase